MSSNPEQDFVLKTIKGRDVHFVRFWFTDVLGNMKSFAVIPSELENAFEDGMKHLQKKLSDFWNNLTINTT